MNNKEMNDATSSRRFQPPVYPRMPTTTTNFTAASNSNHQYYSRLSPFHRNPAAATHFSAQAGPGFQVYQVPPPPLSGRTHASAGGTGESVGVSFNTISQDAVSRSRWVAGSSSYQEPPSLLPQTHSSGGFSGGGGVWNASQVSLPGPSRYQIPPTSPLAPMALDSVPMLSGGVGGSGSSMSNNIRRHTPFLSSLDTGGVTAFNSSVDLYASSSYSPSPLLTQTMASGPTEEYGLKPLPPSISSLPPSQAGTVADLEAVRPALVYSGNKFVPFVDLDMYMDTEGPGDGLISSGHDTGTSTKAPCPPLASPGMSLPVPASADAWVKKEVVDWSSRGTSQLGNNTIAGGSSWPYSSVKIGNDIPQAPWTASSSSSMPPPAANVEVKSEAVDWSWLTSTQPWKNAITSGSSTSTQPPYLGMGSSAAGSSSQYKDDAKVYADGFFTQEEVTKIMADEGLQSTVQTDPMRVKRILRNRRSAHLSTERRKMYLSDLERKVEQLEQQKQMLTAQVHSLQSKTILLRAEEHGIEMKLHGFEQQTQQMDAMTEILNAEILRLKLAAGENMGSGVPGTSYQEMSPQMTQQEQLQIQKHQPAQVQEEEDELTELEKFFMP